MATSTVVPRILSLKRAKQPRHGIVAYANVQSRSRSTRVIHVVTAAKRGRRLRFRCSCEIASFHPQVPCAHIRSVAGRLRGRKAVR